MVRNRSDLRDGPGRKEDIFVKTSKDKVGEV